jgi:hypothetical protein
MLDISNYVAGSKGKRMNASRPEKEIDQLTDAIARRQSIRLDALVRAAGAARGAAGRGLLFASTAGRALVNAAFDLFECDELYRLREDVEHELGRCDGQ